MKSANVFGCLEDTIGPIENEIIEIGDKKLSEFFVKYVKSGCWSFLMSKSSKKCHFSVLSVLDTLKMHVS